MKSFKLKELLVIKNGKDHKALNDGDIPVFGSGGIMRYVDKSICNDESILLPRKGTLSNIQYVNQPFWCVDTIYYSIVDNKTANTFYLFNYLTCLDLSRLNSGTGVPSMTFNSYYDLDVKLPNKHTQQSIAKILSDLDAKIDLNNQINQELEAMAKLLYDYWFVQFDFPNEEGKPYKSSGGKMVYNEELKREIPEGWEVGTFDDIGTVIGGSTPSKAIKENFCINDGTPWITPRDLSSNTGNKFITRGEYDVTKMGIKNGSLKLMSKGTVLLSSRAPVGYLAISREPVTTNQGFKSFEPNKGYSTYFIYYTVKRMMPAIENNAVGSTFKEISGATLKSIKILLPSKDIIHFYDEKSESIFERQDLLELENQQLAELRDWLLPMLMNGQVKVKDATEVIEREMGEGLGVVAEAQDMYGEG